MEMTCQLSQPQTVLRMLDYEYVLPRVTINDVER